MDLRFFHAIVFFLSTTSLWHHFVVEIKLCCLIPTVHDIEVSVVKKDMKLKPSTTRDGGSLGSGNDEERRYMR